MTSAELNKYIDTFRDSHPDLFKDKAVQEAFTSAVHEMGSDMANNMRLIITNKIAVGINAMAQHDLKLLAKEGLLKEELEVISTDPAHYVKGLLTGTWNVAKDIVEMVGYENLNVAEFIKEFGPDVSESSDDDIVFTSNQRGRA